MATALTQRSQPGMAILDRLIQPSQETLPPDAARTLLSLKFQQRDERRMNQLAEKARRGTLSAAERTEAEQYNLISHMVALLQAKARGALHNQGADDDGA